MKKCKKLPVSPQLFTATDFLELENQNVTFLMQKMCLPRIGKSAGAPYLCITIQPHTGVKGKRSGSSDFT
jgi:hypothetical protein